MSVNERLAIVATYYMARFNSKLGFATEREVFEYLSNITDIAANTLKVRYRDVFDYYFPHREGWNLKDPEKQYLWSEDLFLVWDEMNTKSQSDLESILQVMGISTSNRKSGL